MSHATAVRAAQPDADPDGPLQSVAPDLEPWSAAPRSGDADQAEAAPMSVDPTLLAAPFSGLYDTGDVQISSDVIEMCGGEELVLSAESLEGSELEISRQARYQDGELQYTRSSTDVDYGDDGYRVIELLDHADPDERDALCVLDMPNGLKNSQNPVRCWDFDGAEQPTMSFDEDGNVVAVLPSGEQVVLDGQTGDVVSGPVEMSAPVAKKKGDVAFAYTGDDDRKSKKAYGAYPEGYELPEREVLIKGRDCE